MKEKRDLLFIVILLLLHSFFLIYQHFYKYIVPKGTWDKNFKSKIMKHVMLFLFFGLSLPIIAQTAQDSAKLNIRYEYLTIIVTSGAHSVAFIAKDSLKCEKLQLKNDESFNLTDGVKLLSKFNKEGWLVLNSNIALAGDSYPYESCLYYLLYRKKR